MAYATARPVADDSANEKAHSCGTPSWTSQRSCGSSNASGMAARSRPQQISAKSIHEPWSGCWKKQAGEHKTSTCYSLNDLRDLQMQSNWTRCTPAWPGPLQTAQKRGETQTPWDSLESSEGPCVGSRGTGCCQSFCDRPSCWATNLGDGLRVGGLSGSVLPRSSVFAGCGEDALAVAADRRPFALSIGYTSGLWGHQASSASQQNSGSQVQAHTQGPAGAVGGRGQEAAGCQRQSAEGEHLCSVWAFEGYKQANQAVANWSADQYFPFGATERHAAYSTGQIDSADTESLEVAVYVAMVFVAVEGLVQLDEGSWFSGWMLSGDGLGFGRASVDGSGIYSLSGSCQRTSATGLDRAAQGGTRIGSGEVPA